MTDKRIKKALDVIISYGGIDGSHHKQWVLDQVVRTLTDCPTVVKKDIDYKGNPYTFKSLGINDAYLAWVKEYMDGENGPETYLWDTGIAP